MSDPSQESGIKHFFEDLATDYANNVAFENTIWDLKLIFGEYSDNDKAVEWHTSVTIPWAQAKLMQYYLAVNVDAHELEHGKIRIPNIMIPPEPPAEGQTDNPATEALHDIIRRHRAKFIQDLNS